MLDQEYSLEYLLQGKEVLKNPWKKGMGEGVNPRSGLCFYCKKPGHVKSSYPLKKEKDSFIGGGGGGGGKKFQGRRHAMATKERKDGTEETSDAGSMKYAESPAEFLGGAGTKGFVDNEWFMDPRASCHMSSDAKCFEGMEKVEPKKVQFFYGSYVTARL